jgi:hypothetical protein
LLSRSATCRTRRKAFLKNCGTLWMRCPGEFREGGVRP